MFVMKYLYALNSMLLWYFHVKIAYQNSLQVHDEKFKYRIFGGYNETELLVLSP